MKTLPPNRPGLLRPTGLFFLAKKSKTIAFFFTQLTANFVRLVFKNGLDIQVIGLDKVSFISLIIAFPTLAVYLAFLFHLIQF